MHNLTLNSNQPQSPFDSIRHFNEHGVEIWMARDLMPLLGYSKWVDFKPAIERAKASCENTGNPVSEQFSGSILKTTRKGGRPQEDLKLSRYAAYLVAMNSDPRKVEVAAAQSYFATKTREAELIIPAQNLRLKELVAERELIALKGSLVTMHGKEVALALIGDTSQVVEVEKPTIEVIDERHNASFRGQTLVQFKQHLESKTGHRFKSGAEVKRFLERKGLGHLVAQTPRTVLGDYIPEENLAAALRAVELDDRQKLLGE